MTYQVLIIEDDFRVADINRQFIEQAEGFAVAAICHTAADALKFLERQSQLPDLVLLDAYIPDVNGLELLWELRRRFRAMDIVMVTAAREVETIQEALRGGVFDYLIKPIESARMTQMLRRFREERSLLSQHVELEQALLDRTLIRGESATAEGVRLPKGIDPLTLERIRKGLELLGPSQTASSLAQQTGVSRSTARRYLEFMVAQDAVLAELDYGDVGRPERRYSLVAAGS
ncbi:MAG: response regulator [Nitrincola lacisaponensis]|uniref:Transcriptional regulatory protein n=1 Tax=Nitrincola lacisaponensis TaxID=267850 RepID=A0A063Y496_9GAMM|nr:response regulator [Nitrincola lacisaponensis]KDE39945.1 Transcriptional regulatory protein CitB, DpiA [Nitrincola lacisaponensis]